MIYYFRDDRYFDAIERHNQHAREDSESESSDYDTDSSEENRRQGRIRMEIARVRRGR